MHRGLGQYHCASNIISNSHPFHCKWVGPPIPEIKQFQYFTLKRPQGRYNTLSTHITFVQCRWALAFLSIAIKKFDLENPSSRSWLRWTFKVTTWVKHSIDSHPFRSKSINHPIPQTRHFQNLTLKIQGQGHGWGEHWKSQHGPTLYRLTFFSFHVNLPSHSWDTTFSKFDLENPKSRSWVRWMLKATT